MNKKPPLIPGMDTVDYVITGLFVLLFAGAGYFLVAPWAAIPSGLLAVLLVWNAKRNRDRIRKEKNTPR